MSVQTIHYDKCGNIAARCPKCKSIVYIAVNHSSVIQREEKKEIAEMALAGLTIENMTTEQFKKENFGCTCN